MEPQQIVKPSAPLVPVAVPEEPPSIVTLDKLPQEVVIAILSMLSDPQSTSLVSRRMKVLGEAAVEQQLAEKGLNAITLTEKWGVPVDTKSIDVLLHFQVDMQSIASKSKEEALQELSLLLDNRLELLQDPFALREFLDAHLLTYSNMAAKYFYGNKVFDVREGIQEKAPENFLSHCVSKVKNMVCRTFISSHETKATGSPKTPPVRTKKIREMVDFLRDKKSCRKMGVLIVYGGDPRANQLPSLPLNVLALPPLEVYDQLGSAFSGVSIEYASMIPIGIRSMTRIENVSIRNSSMQSLPQELGKMNLKTLFLDNCRNLESLPQTLCDNSTVERLVVRGCPKLSKDDPVVQALIKNKARIYWQ